MNELVKKIVNEINSKSFLNRIFLVLVAVMFLSVLMTSVSHAGTTGTEFKGVYDTLRNWTVGYLGRAIAMAAFVVGLGWGIAKSSPATALSGLAIAFFIMVGPNVLDAVASATF